MGGVDLRMSLIADKLKAQGYYTGVSGKWHGGAHVQGQLPARRGFDRSRVFLNGNEDHYSHYFGIDKGTDMWQDEANLFDNSTCVVPLLRGGGCPRLPARCCPARSAHRSFCRRMCLLLPDPLLSSPPRYGAELYTAHALETIAAFDPSKHAALFMYIPFQNTHSPFQVPDRYLNPARATAEHKQAYLAMGTCMDEAIGNITAAMKQKGLWDNSEQRAPRPAAPPTRLTPARALPTHATPPALFLFSADNGGETFGGGNNYPLRGGKYTDFEGGTRNLAFAAGGWLSPALRNSSTDEMLHIADVWATFAALAGDGAPTVDPVTAAWNAAHPADPVPAPDSVDASAVLTTVGGRSGRTEMPLSLTALIVDGKKIVSDPGKSNRDLYTPKDWPAFDSNNSKVPPGKAAGKCEPFCIFDVFADPEERNDLAPTAAGKAIAATLQPRLAAIAATHWETADHGYVGEYTNCTTMDAYKAAHHGYLGPVCSACLDPPCSATPAPTPAPPAGGFALQRNGNASACLVPQSTAKKAPLALGACGASAAGWSAASGGAAVEWGGLCLRPDATAVEKGACAEGVRVYIGTCSTKCPGMELAGGQLQSTGCPGYCAVEGAAGGAITLGKCTDPGAGGWAELQQGKHRYWMAEAVAADGALAAAE